MNTYNFLVRMGSVQYGIEVNATTEEEAIEILCNEYSPEEGWSYMLL